MLLPEQIDVLAVLIETTGVTLGFTVMLIAFEVAFGADAHKALDVRIHVTTSPFNNVELLNVLLLVPLGEPFTLHWYTGELPPFTAVAVKFTVLPAQTLVVFAAIEMDGVTIGFTVMFKVFEVAEVGDAQVALEVNTTVTASLLANVEELKAFPPMPTLLPLIFHW